MVTTVRQAIHERLDPVIEDIVTREVSQRGAYGRIPEAEQGLPFEALMPILLSTLMQRRPGGQEPQRVLESILPALSIVLPNIIRRQAGQEPQRILQNLLPILPILLPLLLQQQRGQAGLLGQEPQRVLQNLLPVLPALLPAIMQQQQRRQTGLTGQETPWQTLAPALVAALSAC